MKPILLAAALVVGVVIAVNSVAQSGLRAGAKAPEFSAKGTDGKTHSLASLNKHGDVHLYFIKIGCPVNHRAAPYVNSIAKSYGPKGNIVGVINGSESEARAWAKEYGAKFTILADPGKKIIRAYGAQHSPWVVSIDKSGKVSHVYNSVSSTTLPNLNAKVAAATGQKLAKLSFEGAPSGGG